MSHAGNRPVLKPRGSLIEREEGNMAKSVAQIQAMVEKLDPEIRISEEAAEAMTAIPGLFVKMAVKKTVKRAREEGVTLIDMDFAERLRDENTR